MSQSQSQSQHHLIYTVLPAQDPNRRAVPYSRILQLWPGEGSDPFFCSLQVVDISRAPVPFEALSYVWGRDMSDDVLLCGDDQGNLLGQLEITKNLENALRGLRLPSQKRTLWIDAICIRQDDTAERSRQVGYMRSVYQYASRVVVWLGLKDATVRQAFAFAHDMALATAAVHASQPQNLSTRQEIQEWNLRANSSLLEMMRSRPEDTYALDALFRKEYFERVWCIQEVAAGTSIIAKCEDLEIDFMPLLINIPLLVSARGLKPDETGIRMWMAMAMMKGEAMQGAPASVQKPAGSLGPILRVLLMIRNMKATNPVDRIFALMGCTDEGLEPILGGVTTFNGPQNSRGLRMIQRGMIWMTNKINDLGPEMQFGRLPAIRPNYDKTVCEVYRDFARYCVRRAHKVLDVLSHVQHHTDPVIPGGGVDDFPTWVPKFHEPRLASSFVLDVYLAGIPPTGHYPYFAIMHDSPLVQRNIKEPNVLQAEGFRIDVIEAVSDPITQDSADQVSPQTIWSQLFPNIPLLYPRPTLQYVTGSEALDVAFFMTLLAGGIANLLDLGPVGAPSQRDQALDHVTRQAKGDIYEWLSGLPGVNAQAYPDLIRDSMGATRTNGHTRFETCAVMCSLNRQLFRTRGGLLGLGPKFTRPGDVIVVLFGGKYPFTMRQVGTEWMFIGETYLRDEHIMRGGAVTEVRAGKRKGQAEVFRIR